MGCSSVAVHIHYKGFGTLMRQSGAKTPARWQEKPVQVAESLRFMQQTAATAFFNEFYPLCSLCLTF